MLKVDRDPSLHGAEFKLLLVQLDLDDEGGDPQVRAEALRLFSEATIDLCDAPPPPSTPVRVLRSWRH